MLPGGILHRSAVITDAAAGDKGGASSIETGELWHLWLRVGRESLKGGKSIHRKSKYLTKKDGLSGFPAPPDAARTQESSGSGLQGAAPLRGDAEDSGSPPTLQKGSGLEDRSPPLSFSSFLSRPRAQAVALRETAAMSKAYDGGLPGPGETGVSKNKKSAGTARVCSGQEKEARRERRTHTCG